MIRSMMLSRGMFLMVVVSLLAVTGACAAYMADEGNKMVRAHMGHVMTGWKDTPNGKGLLPTALGEAKIAAQHAGFAASKPGNLGWMKTHTRHVLHAVDPSVEAKGPGMGYGVMKGASGVILHIGFASKSPGASGNVAAHTVHVTASTENVVVWAKEIVILGERVLAANSAGEAAPLVARIVNLTGRLVNGHDDNGDGKITWKKGEGGLMEATKHMGFMAKGEGMG